MASGWSYARLSQLAKAAGGPGKWLNLVKNRAFQEGVKAGKGKLIPWLIGAGVAGSLGTIGIMKLHGRKAVKPKKVTAEEAAEAEAILIQGIKDAEQTLSDESYVGNSDEASQRIKEDTNEDRKQ